MKETAITEAMLDALRGQVSSGMSEKRFRHTAEVEKMVARLCALYAPDRERELRAAALLHDITKEKRTDEQIEICTRYGYELRDDEIGSPAILHAITAALVIPHEYPELATDEIISAVRWHTTGREGMTLAEKIIYLADYIEDTRKYDECIALRNMFFDAKPDKMTTSEAEKHLDRVILRSLDMTVNDIKARGGSVCSDTLLAQRYFEEKLR